VLVVGAGITGIYQLFRALEEGFTARLVEAGSGVGGTWYWNRYPGCRFDSESYTYAYLFSKELFDEWEWREHFAAQPDTERYLNHVVDRFELREHIRLDTRVTGADWDDATRTWLVATGDGRQQRARFVVAATGVLSVPYFPDVPGRDEFNGVQVHTGQWPTEGVDLAGKRVAVIGTGSSGVQIVPAIVDEVASLTVYQRTANWCTPLNNRPITPEEQAELRAGFEQMKKVLDASIAGFLHEPSGRNGADETAEARRAFFQEMWDSPGFTKLSSNYTDLLTDPAVNAEWCDFIAEKVRSIVRDPAVAEQLIPSDHRFGEKRPPFVNGWYEAFNDPKVSLVDLKATPIVRVTSDGIETADGVQPFDVIVWSTGFDFGTGALNRIGIRGRGGVPLAEHWADGPKTFLGVQTTGFPNLFFPGGPHAAAGNNPRYNGDQVDFVMDLLLHVRAEGFEVVEVTEDAERRWTDMVDRGAELAPFGERSYFFGTNIPGKPRKYLLNSGGRPKLFKEIARVHDTGFEAFHLSADEGDM
jgi:cation diffusion facilitator CzcD-associated flavoprotein CzcO